MPLKKRYQAQYFLLSPVINYVHCLTSRSFLILSVISSKNNESFLIIYQFISHQCRNIQNFGRTGRKILVLLQKNLSTVSSCASEEAVFMMSLQLKLVFIMMVFDFLGHAKSPPSSRTSHTLRFLPLTFSSFLLLRFGAALERLPLISQPNSPCLLRFSSLWFGDQFGICPSY